MPGRPGRWRGLGFIVSKTALMTSIFQSHRPRPASSPRASPDFDKPSAARAAYDSAAQLFCLRHKPTSRDATFTASGQPASLTPDLQRLVRSLHTSKGAYSEVFVQNADRHGLYRFYADQYSYWLYTTNPKDKMKREVAFKREQALMPAAPHGELMARACRALAEEGYKALYGKTPREFLGDAM